MVPHLIKIFIESAFVEAVPIIDLGILKQCEGRLGYKQSFLLLILCGVGAKDQLSTKNLVRYRLYTIPGEF